MDETREAWFTETDVEVLATRLAGWRRDNGRPEEGADYTLWVAACDREEARAILAALASRPRSVEVTEAMVERAAKVAWMRYTTETPWEAASPYLRSVYTNDARAILKAALEGE